MMASALLAFGIAFTAMRSVRSPLPSAAAWSSGALRRALEQRFWSAAIAFVIGFGGVLFGKRGPSMRSRYTDSASLRLQVARVGMARLLAHPLFGHGMDAVKAHWAEWGFPGNVIIHLHSTPLQIAFDRGLPALFFWFDHRRLRLVTTRSEKATRDSGDANRHGLLLAQPAP